MLLSHGSCIEMFEAQARRIPGSLAVVSAEGTLTYAALQAQSNQLARALRGRGVNSETPVGVCLERSLRMPVALLGILKAGAGYVPLDPSYPQARRDFMLADAGVRLVVTQQSLLPHLPPDAETLCLDTDWPLIAVCDDMGFPESAADALFYVIYTSGSTGTPKGVRMGRAAIANLVDWQGKASVRPDARTAQFAALGFDVSAQEIFSTLCGGGTLVLVPEPLRQDPLSLVRFLGDQKIERLFLPFVALQQVAEAALAQPAGLLMLREVITAGEQLKITPAIRALFGRLPHCILHNHYGPSETHVATAYTLSGPPETWPALPPIGRAVPDMQTLVLDDELCLGGVQLAQGYAGRPDLTAERFVAGLPGADPQTRWYRTGDRVRVNADGDLEFLGRVDGQLKIRGFRVEPGEVETALLEYPGISQAAVSAHEFAPGDTRLIAYLAATKTIATDQLRLALEDRLPKAMVPSRFEILEKLPLTPSGKVDRLALPAPSAERPALGTAFAEPQPGFETALAQVWQDVLGLTSIGRDDSFFDLGGRSLQMVQVHQKMRDLAPDAAITTLFQFPTIRGLAQHLTVGSQKPTRSIRSSTNGTLDAVAIVGLAGRFPGAANAAQFWENVKNGTDSITHFSDSELAEAGIAPEMLSNPDYVKARGVLENADLFDAAFFGIPPKEADVLDPQHRLFLECAWEALEDAGCDPETYPGTVGVWAGSSLNTYLLSNLCGTREVVEELTQSYQVGNYPILAGNDKDFLPTRVSYKLNLKGPSMSVGTGCSTSLVAVAQACQSLQAFGCDMALAGGVSVAFPQTRGYLYQPGGMVSPDGACRAFDAKSEGTVFGGGVGVAVLKRLADAVADRDTIYAVIKGHALNNDGAQKASYTAPSADGQAEAIASAQAMAGFSADTISYIEAHGTATPLGDPIEIAGLTQAFRRTTDKTGFCALGSAKPNTGHLEAASGVTGLIKTALALKHKLLPPLLHFESPNPRIDFPHSPFTVSAKLTEWPEGDGPRRAGVSSFGVGGTNAHVVLEEAPPVRKAQTQASRSDWHLLTLSARTEAALETATDNLARHLRAHPETDLADAAYTLQTGRRAFAHRRTLVCRTAEDAAAALETRDPARMSSGKNSSQSRPVAFLFPGQGAQQVNMGRALYETEPVFQAQMDDCCERLKPLLGLDLRETFFPSSGDEEAAQDRLNQTALAQPALFVFGYALAKLWMSWGVSPSAMLGHSVGEYVAACLSGVFSLPDALTVLAGRARLMQSLPPGAMLAVRQPASEVHSLLGKSLALAVDNSPSLCVVSGPAASVEALEAQLGHTGVACRRLPTSHAFHSAMMDPILEEFTEIVQSVPRHVPALPFLSNLSGDWITDADATDPKYWARHLRGTVRFAEGVGMLLADPNAVLLEIGPAATLAPLARQHPKLLPSQEIVASLEAGKAKLPGDAACLSALGRLWQAGVPIDWPSLHHGQGRRRISLPTYPFERTRHWVEPPRVRAEPDPKAVRPMPELTPAPPENAAPARSSRLLAELCGLLHELSGVPLDRIGAEATFLDLGFDSLFLTQAGAAIGRKFGVKVAFRTLLEDAPTPASLAALLDRKMPPDPAPPVVARAAPASVPAPVSASAPTAANSLEQIVSRQLALMESQLALLRGETPAPAAVPVPQPGPEAVVPMTAAIPKIAPAAFGPYKPIDTAPGGGLTDRQQSYLDDFISRYVAKTPESKRLTQLHRAHLADPRAVAGFKNYWKEMVYPLVAERSAGAYLWDVDGNKHVDLTMGFGTNLFGHSPVFITEAITKQLPQGIEIGPQSLLAGEVAKLVCEMTGMDRATFCNTGSEAVMAAMRAARTVTGRTKIVYFTGDYHGTFDEVLARANGEGEQRRAVPIAPGIPSCMTDEIVILDYGTPETLEAIRGMASDLAAVLIEPVQSRRPDLQPLEFLHEVRRITAEAGAALIFDEVITGFRVHPGGAQAWFGIEADLATYGKIVGGGMPIGIVTGKAEYMDAFDGGQWQFGDASWPEAGVTFFAGTFVRHPLALAAAKATLEHLKAAGPQLQETLNARTTAFVETLNAHFERVQVPIRLANFGSLFYFKFAPDLKWASLLFFHLRHKNVHLWEGRPCFLSTAHSDADIAQVIQAFQESVAEMQQGGFLPGSTLTLPDDLPQTFPDELPQTLPDELPQTLPDELPQTLPDDLPQTLPDDLPQTFPLTEAQKGIWLTTQMGTDASCAFNESVVLHLQGTLDADALRQALQETVSRHDALRTALLPSGEGQKIASAMTVDMPLDDLSALSAALQETREAKVLAEEACTPFDLTQRPLLRARLIRRSGTEHHFVLTAHHVVCDGWSFGVLLADLDAAYSSLRRGQSPSLAPAPSFRGYAAKTAASKPEEAANTGYWVRQLTPAPPPLRLPADRPRPSVGTYRGARASRLLTPALADALRRFSLRSGATLPATLLAAFTLLLHGLSGKTDVVVWVPAADQALEDDPRLIGHCVSLLPVRVPAAPSLPFADYLSAVRRVLSDALDHQRYSFSHVMEALDRPVPISTTFNIDRFPTDLGFGGLDVTITHPPRRFFQFDLGLNVIEEGERLELECDYSVELFNGTTAEHWLDALEDLLQKVTEEPAACLEALTSPLQSEEAAPQQELKPLAKPLPLAMPQTKTEARLAALWREVLGVPAVGAGDNFFALGGYSLLALRLYGRIEQEFGVRLPLPTLFQAPTLEALAEILSRDSNSASSEMAHSTLVPLRETGSKPALFCIHPDHGLVLFYQALANRLSPEQPVYGLQSVGLDSDEAPLQTLEEMAARYLRDIQRFQPAGPYHLGGYSLGGVVAAEMSRQLHAAGESVGLLALFDAYAPVAYQQNLIDKPRLRRMAGHLQSLRGSTPKAAFQAISEKAQEALRGKKADWQKAAEELAGALAPARLAALQTVILANEAAFFRYRTPPYPAHATLFRALEVSVFEERDPALWWGDKFLGGLEIHDVSGAHLTLMNEPQVQALAAALQRCLDEAG